ncbi:MAG: hypothetical protein AABY22_25845 [Nanoarchaeota archaeon]
MPKKSKNPFLRISPYVWGFVFSAIFVFLLVTAYITDSVNDGITNNVIDKFEQGCYVTFKDLPVNLERCVKKSNEARTFEVLNKEICGCNEERKVYPTDFLLFSKSNWKCFPIDDDIGITSYYTCKETKERLCLEGDDLAYCQQGFEQSQKIINLRSTLKSMTNLFTRFNILINTIIIMGLFVIGFIFGWIIILIKRK